jgi:hypothetical protein
MSGLPKSEIRRKTLAGSQRQAFIICIEPAADSFSQYVPSELISDQICARTCTSFPLNYEGSFTRSQTLTIIACWGAA